MYSLDSQITPEIRDRLRGALPEAAALAVWSIDATEADLREAEGRWVGRAVDTRRVEFLRGRACARRALEALGGPVGAEIPIGPTRDPLWPDGFVGSITHTAGFVAAVVSTRQACQGIGVDVERGSHLPGATARIALRPEEQRHLPPPLDLVGFSAKESIYKAVRPSLEHGIDFADARLRIEGPERFAVEWTTDLPTVPSERLSGWYATGEDWVATLVRYAPDSDEGP